MTDVFVVDLGEEYGEVLVEGISPFIEGGTGTIVQAGVVDDAVNFIKVRIQEILQAPLIGLGLAFRTSLPNTALMDNEYFELDEFSVEFQIGLSSEVGLNIGAVVKVVPNGSFNCTYSWKRRRVTT